MSFFTNLDQQTLAAFNSVVGHSGWLDTLIKVFAIGLIYLVPATLLGFWFYSRHSKKPALTALVAAGVTLALSRVIGVLWSRPRPFETDVGIREIAFHRPTYSFPSEHAALLAALTVSCWISSWPKLGWWFLTLTIIISLLRIVVGFHFPSDILGGLVVGTASALLVRLADRPLTTVIYRPIIKLARKLHLA